MLLIPDSKISLNGHSIWIEDWRIYNNGEPRDRVELKGFIVSESSKKKPEPESVKQLTPKLSKEETIETVLKHFDFYKVEKVMKGLNWIWHSAGGVPIEFEVKQKARELLSEVYRKVQESTSTDESSIVMSTGGLRAEAIKYPDGEITVDLKFVLTEFNYSNQDTCY